MAKVTYIDPVKSVSGKLAKKSRVTFMVRQAATSNADMLENPNYTHVMGKRKTQVSAAEKAYRTRFGKICKETTVRLHDPAQMKNDTDAFAAQSQYTTLRQYVWHQVADSITI